MLWLRDFGQTLGRLIPQKLLKYSKNSAKLCNYILLQSSKIMFGSPSVNVIEGTGGTKIK